MGAKILMTSSFIAWIMASLLKVDLKCNSFHMVSQLFMVFMVWMHTACLLSSPTFLFMLLQSAFEIWWAKTLFCHKKCWHPRKKKKKFLWQNCSVKNKTQIHYIRLQNLLRVRVMCTLALQNYSQTAHCNMYDTATNSLLPVWAEVNCFENFTMN